MSLEMGWLGLNTAQRICWVPSPWSSLLLRAVHAGFPLHHGERKKSTVVLKKENTHSTHTRTLSFPPIGELGSWLGETKGFLIYSLQKGQGPNSKSKPLGYKPIGGMHRLEGSMSWRVPGGGGGAKTKTVPWFFLGRPQFLLIHSRK